jgi:hypothetical protein
MAVKRRARITPAVSTPTSARRPRRVSGRAASKCEEPSGGTESVNQPKAPRKTTANVRNVLKAAPMGFECEELLMFSV